MTGAPPFHDEERIGRAYDAHLMHRLLRYLRPYRRHVAGAVGLLLAGAGLQLVGPYLTQQALDRAVPAGDMGLLAVLGAIFLAALALEFTVEYGHTLLTAWLGQRVMSDLRREIFAKLQRLSIPFFDRNPVGRLMTRVTSDVETLNELFTAGVVAVFGDLFTLGAILIMMAALDWRLTLVAVAAIPAILGAALLFRWKVRDTYRDIRLRLARINAFLQEHLSGMRVVQLFGREAAAASDFRQVNRAHLDAHLRSIRVYAVFFPVIEVLTAVALALLLWYGGLRALDDTLTVGVLAAFLQLTRRSFQPLQDLSEKYNVLQSAMASSERIFSLLDREPAIVEPARPRALPRPVLGEVAFEHVWFRYAPSGPWVLRDVSFTASPGRTVALVGHTGAGKTTVINLLLRFYDVDRGRITIDGEDIHDLSLHEVRSAIGLVQQDIFLFTDDVLSNLTLGDEARVRAATAAAARLGVDRIVARLPDTWRFRLGERGQFLSVGERQLLAFARALTADPAILVLDEATSSVDTETELRVQAAIREVMRGRTSIVIAHRLSTVLEASTILVLHHGEVRERGTHFELLRVRGLYERLYQLQLGTAASRAS